MSFWSQRAFWAVFAAAVSFFAAFYTLLVPLPRYMTALGLPDWQIGLVMGAFGIASLCGRPVAGACCDRFGVRPVIITGALALACGGMAVIATQSVVVLFVCRILQALGYVAFTTASTALVSDLVPAATRGVALARFGAAANVAISLVPALVTNNLDTLTLAGAFVLCGVLALGSGAVVLTVVPTQASASAQIPWRALLTFPRIIWPAMLTTWLFGVGFGAYLSYLPILAERRSIPAIGWVYTVYGIAIIVTRMLTGKLLDRPDRRDVLLPSAVMMAAGMLCFAMATNVWWLACAAVLTASSGGIWHPALIAIHVDSVAQRGRATAAFYVAFDLGIGAGTWVLAAALQAAGIGAVFVVAAVLVVLAGITTRWIVHVQPH